MRRPWGQKQPSTMPGRKAVWTMTALVVAVVAMVGAAVYQYEREWTFFQREYLKTYINSGVRTWMKTASYSLAYRIEGKQERVAVDEDFNDPAVLHGKAKLHWEYRTYDNAKLHEWLEQVIYGGQAPWMLLWPMMWKVGLGVLVLGLWWAVPKDQERKRLRREGLRLKGPEAVTAEEFNRRNQSDGVGFLNEDRSFTDKILGRNKVVRIPRERESSHFLILGDTGSGKSSLIRQALMQIEERNEAAIVHDSQLEYTAHFYRRERGDVILNPLDARMPYWSPCEEVQHEAEAEDLAAALFKDDPRSNPFFVMVPRQIFAHLLTEDRKRTPAELLAILRDERELARRLKDTEHAAAIHPEAGPQRGGMLATLNSVASALKLLPRREETETSWTATEWAKRRQGWLFITSPPEFRERLRPLISMWLDMLVLRLMNQGQPGARPVWFILDELASLHKLPQLHTAITQNRKSGNPVVLGFQGRSQLEATYGHQAEVMLSQPATKIFLKTSEADSAEWISKMIGNQEVERVREGRSSGSRKSENETTETGTKPLVMDSEITGLKNLHGYLKGENLVVRMSSPYVASQRRQEAFLPRVTQMQPKKEDATKAAAAGQEKDPYFE